MGFTTVSFSGDEGAQAHGVGGGVGEEISIGKNKIGKKIIPMQPHDEVLIVGCLPPLHGSYRPALVGSLDSIGPVYEQM